MSDTLEQYETYTIHTEEVMLKKVLIKNNSSSEKKMCIGLFFSWLSILKNNNEFLLFVQNQNVIVISMIKSK